MLACTSLVEAQTIQTVCAFNGANGAQPFAGLTLGNDGNLYGTTYGGGSSDGGTVFQVSTNGVLTTLVSFAFTNGWNPEAALTLGNDGSFYGTTALGGLTNSAWTRGMGTVFKMTTSGTFTTLVSFAATNGVFPEAALTLGNDGKFYGTTQGGGNNYVGTVFKMTTSGTLTTLFSFAKNNGANPQAALTQANDGSFYGTTKVGGYSDVGTVFRVMTNGTFTTLSSFAKTNGVYPNALTLGTDGNFYGTTYSGGSANSTYPSGMGTVFRVTTNGTLTTLVSFNGANGMHPYAALTLGIDGNFYGTTFHGGKTNLNLGVGWGTVFRVTTNGTLTTLATFTGANGAYPRGSLTLGNDGTLYGTTQARSSGGAGVVFRLLLPPIITVQPQSQTNIAGATVRFTATAIGPESLHYQWQKNGTNLLDGGKASGSSSNTLTLTSISDSDAASYLVIVSNSEGTVTSSKATLTVIDPPLITAQPANRLVLPGTNVAFDVSVISMVPFRYQWRFNGTNLLNATNAAYTILVVGTNHAGSYSVVVTNAAGRATSSNAALAVLLSPNSRTNYAGSTATFTVRTVGSELRDYQWQRHGTNLFDGGNISGTTNSTLTIANVAAADAGIYGAVVGDGYSSVTAFNATLTVIDPPLITAQPVNLLVLPGTNVGFGVSVSSMVPFRYQWRFNGTNLLNATNGIYLINLVGTNNAGNYAVVITNAVGSATSSNAALTVVLSPKSRTNYAGSTATFTAAAFGPESLNYQWQKNGTNLTEGGKLSGATNSTLTIADVSDADAAVYSAVVSDAYGSVTTSNAVLTVVDLPFIATQPRSQTVGLGSNVVFDVTAYGASPLVFQWYFNGTPSGSSGTGTNYSTYTLTNVGTNQAGIYSILVVNDHGSVTSSNAVLTVKVFSPTIGLQPSSQSVMLGGSASFSVSVSGTPPFRYQWRFNGTNLLNTTNASYAIQAVATTNTGRYSVIVTNSAGSATSSNALLTVIVPPTLALQFLAAYPLLDLSGMLSSNFVVQYRTNLAGTNWVNLLSLTNLPSSPYRFLDSGGVGQPWRFYRAFMQ